MADPIDDQKTRIKNTIDNAKHFLYTAGTLYEFMPNGIYMKAEDQQVASYLTALSIKQFGVDLFSNHDVEEFTNYIKRKSFMRWDEIQAKQDKSLIPFNNTIFNIKEFKPVDSTELLNIRERYFFFQIPHNLNEKMLNESLDKGYTPEQALKIFAPKIYQFFADIVGEDKVILQLAKIGYTFYPSNPFKLMFMELGPKDAGKTSFLKLFTYVIGERNISTISLQDLADYRFARAELWGKLANIYDDIPLTTVRNQGILKMLSGESRIDAPIKYKQEIQSFVNTGKSIYTANRLPYVFDSTDEAFFSRWVITNYPNHFPRNDKFFSNLISNEQEIEGLIVASLLALRDLLIGKFHFEDKTQENMDLWQRQNNNVYAFIVDSLQAGTYELGEDLKIEKDLLYQAYTDYCNEMETDAKSKTKFTQDLQRLFGISTIKIRRGGTLVWGYSGIGIKTSVQTEIEKYEQPQPADTPTTTKPDNAPTNPTTPDTSHAATKSSASPHSDTQAQANQEVLSPNLAEPVPDNHNAEQATQTQQQTTVMLSRTTQQTRAAEKEILATPQQQDARKREALQRVYNAVCVAERKHEPFWEREDLGEPNENLFPALEGLTTDLIENALQTLEWQGYIYQQKPNHWRTVRRLYIADIVYYNDPEHPVYCPNCGKPVSKLFWFGGDWVCLNCLAKKKSQRGE